MNFKFFQVASLKSMAAVGQEWQLRPDDNQYVGEQIGESGSSLLISQPGLPEGVSAGHQSLRQPKFGLDLNIRKIRLTLWSIIYIIICTAELNYIQYRYSDDTMDDVYLRLRFAAHFILLFASFFTLIQNAWHANPICCKGCIVVLWVSGGILHFAAAILGMICYLSLNASFLLANNQMDDTIQALMILVAYLMSKDGAI